jgi:hypothetical protein
MRFLVLLALAAAGLFWAPRPAQAQLVKSYGDVGAWSVLLVKDPHGDEYCLASTRQPPNGPAGENLSFAVDSNYTRIFLGYQGPAVPTPGRLALAVDGLKLVSLKLVYPQSDFGPALHLIVVDLPDDLLRGTIFPAMADESVVTADAGAIRFSVPINHFDVILNELDDCARRERIDDASLN